MWKILAMVKLRKGGNTTTIIVLGVLMVLGSFANGTSSVTYVGVGDWSKDGRV